MKSERTRRLFFALWPDQRMQSALTDATRNIVDASDGRPVPPQNYHLTLAFLGSVPESKMALLQPIAANTAATFRTLAGVDSAHPRIDITLDNVELWRRAEILCAVSREAVAHGAALARTLQQALIDGGFSPDVTHEWRVHVTLARNVRSRIRAAPITPLVWRFTGFALMQSQQSARGSEYRLLYSFDF